jgi:mannose/fructose/N-acetylgalactosamine-specific phosphotransferase system component IID
LSASIAVVGNLFAPVLFLVGINIIHFASRWYGLQYAFRYGQRVFERLGGTQLERVRESAVMVGLLVVGALVATLLPITTSLEYTVRDAQIALQDFLDEILMGMIPLAITLVVFWLVRRGFNPLYILIALTIVGFAGGYFGILSAPEL